jgi:cellulose synthase/poly-beta-1,6-N-acetylglucosamine synthase-like glycosyltransferase
VNETFNPFNPNRLWPQQLASAQLAVFFSENEHQLSLGFDEAPACRPTAKEDLVTRAWFAATASGTTLDRYLIDNEMVDEDTLYRAFANVLGVPFLNGPFAFPDDLDGLSLLESGHAPLLPDNGVQSYIVAPTGGHFEGLLRAKAMGIKTFEGANVSVTSPHDFKIAVRKRFGPCIAADANRRLALTAPWMSAEKIFGWWSALGIGLGIVLFFLALLAVPDVWDVMCFGLIIFPSVPSLQLKTLAIMAGNIQEPVPGILLDRDLPTYTVLVPVYREARIISRLVQRLRRIDYPRTKLDFKILVESDDFETQSALRCEKLPPNFDVIVCPPGKPRTKPRALNIGLSYAKGEYVVIYDAEDEPEPNQLRKVAAQFSIADKTVACVQARLAIDNIDDSWVSRLFALEYAGLFDGLLPGMSATRQPIPLGGTSNHFRRSTLEACFAWDAWNVTEDADLGLRLAGLGYQSIVIDSTTWEEAPVNLRAWFHQRSRWLKGWIQTALVISKPARYASQSIPRLTRFEILVISWSAVISCLFHPVLLLIPGLIFGISTEDAVRSALHLTLWSFISLFVTISGLLSITIMSIGAQRRGVSFSLNDICYLLLYSLMKTAAAWRALFDFIVAPTHWNKTEHGIARSSRLYSEHGLRRI